MESGQYSRVARWLHWGMALLIIGNLAGGLLHDIAPQQIMPLHKANGILLLALAIVRIGWRLTHKGPDWPDSLSAGARRLSSLTHAMLYGLMVLIPLSGWIMSSASDRPISFFGLFDVPKFAVTKEDLIAGISHEGHEILAFMMIALLVLHIAAALRHHFILKDGIMARMLG
ncbi:cytochrome b [Sphingomonas lacunae]|uniref:Cytochrome b n=1 Tax=Sphingomonas lacunae TaxID=2698828 RepID=A0A6M4ARM3_9SPHN|nr:cytochrome b [Sphingomonas lacunae]QJQ31673.1 cytochrome b [Sphingomonas lacunae]